MSKPRALSQTVRLGSFMVTCSGQPIQLFRGKCVWHIFYVTYSLTAALDRLRVLAISTTNERSRVANWKALVGRPISSFTCWNEVLRGQPGGRFQSVAGGVPVKASMDRCSACETGVSLDNRQMWPKSEWLWSAMREGRSVSLVVSFIAVLMIWSYHFTPRIRRWDCMWNDCVKCYHC